MNHNTFTDYQIIEAKHAAARHMNRGLILRCDVQDIRAFLDALPDPAPSTEWQANGAEVLEIGDVREGDRVLIKSTEGSFYEVTITSISSLREPVGITLRWADGSIYESSIDSIYLFNRPIVHPDPAQHPVIIDEAGRPWFSAGLDEYHSPHQHSIFRNPRDFETWTPGKVIEDDR